VQHNNNNIVQAHINISTIFNEYDSEIQYTICIIVVVSCDFWVQDTTA